MRVVNKFNILHKNVRIIMFISTKTNITLFQYFWVTFFFLWLLHSSKHLRSLRINSPITQLSPLERLKYVFLDSKKSSKRFSNCGGYLNPKTFFTTILSSITPDDKTPSRLWILTTSSDSYLSNQTS